MTFAPTTPHDRPHDGPRDGSSHWRQAIWILVAATLIRLALAATVPLYADEAYYWEWSRRLAAGYFDQPPMIAWLVSAGTALVGESPLGVRLFPVLTGLAGGYALVRTASHLAGESAARFAALLVAVIPLMAGGLALATPDAPMFAGVAITLYAVVRAVDPAEDPRDALRYWLLAGIAIGFAMLSKFTSVLVPIGVLSAFAAERSLRRHFASPGPWLAVAVASLMMTSVLVWNAQHEWISFTFQLQHGLGGGGRGTWLTREGSLFLGQLGVVSPILFGLLVVAATRALRQPREPMRFVLGTAAAFVLLFFAVSATRRPVEPNWPAVAWMAAILLLAAERSFERTRAEKWAVVIAGVISAGALAHVVRPFLPLDPRGDPTIKSHGWPALAATVDSTREALADRKPVVAVNRYQDAALLAYHLADRPTVLALNLGTRQNQYDLWPQFPERAERGATILLVVDARSESDSLLPTAISHLAPHFTSFERGARVALRRGDAVFGERRIWVLSGWTGTWPTEPTELNSR